MPRISGASKPVAEAKAPSSAPQPLAQSDALAKGPADRIRIKKNSKGEVLEITAPGDARLSGRYAVGATPVRGVYVLSPGETSPEARAKVEAQCKWTLDTMRKTPTGAKAFALLEGHAANVAKLDIDHRVVDDFGVQVPRDACVAITPVTGKIGGELFYRKNDQALGRTSRHATDPRDNNIASYSIVDWDRYESESDCDTKGQPAKLSNLLVHESVHWVRNLDAFGVELLSPKTDPEPHGRSARFSVHEEIATQRLAARILYEHDPSGGDLPELTYSDFCLPQLPDEAGPQAVGIIYSTTEPQGPKTVGSLAPQLVAGREQAEYLSKVVLDVYQRTGERVSVELVRHWIINKCGHEQHAEAIDGKAQKACDLSGMSLSLDIATGKFTNEDVMSGRMSREELRAQVIARAGDDGPTVARLMDELAELSGRMRPYKERLRQNRLERYVNMRSDLVAGKRFWQEFPVNPYRLEARQCLAEFKRLGSDINSFLAESHPGWEFTVVYDNGKPMVAGVDGKNGKQSQMDFATVGHIIGKPDLAASWREHASALGEQQGRFNVDWNDAEFLLNPSQMEVHRSYGRPY